MAKKLKVDNSQPVNHPFIDLTVEPRPMGTLVPYDRNARTHTAEQVARIAASIQQFGWTNPILLGSDNIVIAGHARLAAAHQLGMSEVPVIVLGHLTEAQRRALVVADNQLSLGAGWDEELLRSELQALRDLDFNLDLVGFDVHELDKLLADAPDESGDDVPQVPDTPATRIGDVWLLGAPPRQHRVLCAGTRRARPLWRSCWANASRG